jgi:hypothetical protein
VGTESYKSEARDFGVCSSICPYFFLITKVIECSLLQRNLDVQKNVEKSKYSSWFGCPEMNANTFLVYIFLGSLYAYY